MASNDEVRGNTRTLLKSTRTPSSARRARSLTESPLSAAAYILRPCCACAGKGGSQQRAATGCSCHLLCHREDPGCTLKLSRPTDMKMIKRNVVGR